MKKILFIIASYTKGGGAESLLTTIVNNLNPVKYKIDIIEIMHADIKTEPVNDNITVLPYIMRTDDPERKHKLYYVYHEPEKVFKEFIHDEYDLHVSFNVQRPSFLLPPGKKNIAWIHSDVYKFAQERYTEERELQNQAFDKVAKIVSISDITTQSLIDVFPKYADKIVEIYNGLDIDRVRKKAQEDVNITLEHPSILFIGRLDERKNPVRLFDVFKLVHAFNENVHLYYLGYGPFEESIRQMATECGLESHVHFLGYHENPFPIIKQTDLVCHLSKSEGFPMCMLESQALGKPIVSTVIGGSRILINNDLLGRVITTDEEAANAILKFLSLDKLKVKEACEKSILRFSLNGYIYKIENLFDKVLEM